MFQLLIDGISETEIWAESVESSISGDYHRVRKAQSIRGRLEGVREVNMETAEQFIKHIPWSEAEKKTARRAFDKALEMQCTAIMAEAKQMIANATTPFDIWKVHDYLSEQRKTVDRLYDYRYSVLLDVFSCLLRDGWLTEADLTGLRKEKIESIKIGAAF